MKVVALALVTAGASLTLSVKVCSGLEPAVLVAVKVIE